MQFPLRWLLPSAALLLAACASLQPAPEPPSTPEVHAMHLAKLDQIRSFTLQARIGVQTNSRGFSGSANWQHGIDVDHILLFSPLGGQVAQIDQSADGVSLVTSEGKTLRADSAEQLTEEALGWTLPMQGLPDWALGRPTAGDVDTETWDAAGRLTFLQQHGWKIEYGQYTSGKQSLPGKVTLKSDKLNLKLVIERWEIETAQQ